MPMEALLFMVDSFLVVTMVYMGLADDRRAPCARPRSIFRTIEDEGPASPAPNPDVPGERRGQHGIAF